MWTNDGASPRTHVDIISIIHSVANSAIPNTFFSPFKFLQQSEVSWDCMEIQSSQEVPAIDTGTLLKLK